MTVTTTSFTTGPCTLPDIGTLGYNGCQFSPLFESSISGSAIVDNAGRTTKWMEYLITVEGYVTLPAGATSTDGVMQTLHKLLSAQGGNLVYKGRGFDLNVNPQGGQGFVSRDVAWGPAPEVLEFQPLGAGNSAKVRWQCTVHIASTYLSPTSTTGRATSVPLLQFNYETSVTYGEDYYSGFSIRGTIEVPIARGTSIQDRRLTYTADDARREIEPRIMDGIDLSLFYVTHREFNVSRDKRTLEFTVECEEKPYMDQPIGCTVAHGSYSFRPAKAGMGLCLWLCTLRCTYNVRADQPRRVAWFAFLALLQLRMSQSKLGNVPREAGQNPSIKPVVLPALQNDPYNAGQGVIDYWKKALKILQNLQNPRKAWLIDFSGEEGMHRDSKTVTFSATWRLVTTFSHILIASGLWKKRPEKNAQGQNVWAISMKDVSGSQSWLANELDPKLDVIVDFGGG